MTYPTVLKTGALKDVFTKIVKTGVPTKFTVEHLKSLGYTSSNDQPIIAALKFIGFLDASGIPTDKYKSYRGKDGSIVLAQGIKTGYSDLFQLYPDADQKDEESLTHFFATKTNVGERALKAMVATFKALCSIADFQSDSNGVAKVDVDDVGVKNIEKKPAIVVPPRNGGVPININIELQVPATNDPEVYKNFFEAMKKYLLTD